jgi:hypothetical protein
MNKIHNVFYMKDRYKRFIFGDYIILPIISSSIDILFLNKTFKLFKRFGDCILLVIVSSPNVKLCLDINSTTIIVKTYSKYNIVIYHFIYDCVKYIGTSCISYISDILLKLIKLRLEMP